MNIVYSSDNNYLQHLCVSMVSLLENNTDADELNIFIISNNISIESQSKVNCVAQRFGRSVTWIDFEPFQRQLILNMEWEISLSSYARLFLADMLPEWCTKVIYIDCDTVVCDSLREMYEIDMTNYAVAGVADLILDTFKTRVGLTVRQTYINAGILVINLSEWRQKNMTGAFLDFIESYHGSVPHHDQGTINGTLQNSCKLIHPKYNVMTPFYTQKYNRLLKFYHLNDYYPQDEIAFAVKNPVIIHYTPEYTGRVWETNCRHPQKDRYFAYLQKTPWCGNIIKSPRRPLKRSVIYWVEQKFPVPVIDLIRRGLSHLK